MAKPLGLNVERAAYGAHQIAASNMIRAIKAVSSERGRDPRRHTLFAFGGNGPLFAATMARELGMTRIVVPPAPGLFSSFGLLYADVEHHYSRTVRRILREADPAELDAAWSELESRARAQLSAEGFPPERTRLIRSANVHYKGQIFELTVGVADRQIDAKAIEAIEESFGVEHERTYGHRAGPGEPVELVNVEVIGQGIPERPRIPDTLRPEGEDRRMEGSRSAYFGPDLGWIDTPVISREDLKTERDGPFIVEEYDATCLAPRGVRGVLDDYGNIVLGAMNRPGARKGTFLHGSYVAFALPVGDGSLPGA